jgi:hypothetical protein
MLTGAEHVKNFCSRVANACGAVFLNLFPDPFITVPEHILILDISVN